MQGLEEILEEFGSYICDELCYYRETSVDKQDDEMEEICAGCKVGKYLESIRKHMNDGWIPVEDRLPEDTESGFYNAVSVTMSNGRVTHGCYRNADREWWVAREDGEFKYTRSDEVIAWRPLPEPYRLKKESEGSRRLREREEFFKG